MEPKQKNPEKQNCLANTANTFVSRPTIFVLLNHPHTEFSTQHLQHLLCHPHAIFLGHGLHFSLSTMYKDMLATSDCAINHTLLERKMVSLMGEGPAMFGPVQTEIKVGTKRNLDVFEQFKRTCNSSGLSNGYTNAQILRTLQFTGFNERQSVRLLKRMDSRYFNMTAQELEKQLMTKTIFPLPGVASQAAQDFCYMRPSRFFPNITSTSTLIANLTYVLDSIYERHRDPTRTVGLIANMNDWKMENFSLDCTLKFMEVLQGNAGPNQVDLFLIVNPPTSFRNVWKKLKPRLQPSFRERVCLISEYDLGTFLDSGYEEHLPSELSLGSANADELVRNFVCFRMFVEAETRERIPNNYIHCSSSSINGNTTTCTSSTVKQGLARASSLTENKPRRKRCHRRRASFWK